MTALPSGAVIDDSAGEIVAARSELALEVGHEHTEIRVVRTWVHLRDEKNPQRAYPRVT